MIVKKAGGQIYGATLTAAERKAMNIEIEKQLAEYTRKHALELDAILLWYVHEAFGFGPKRLKQVFMGFAPLVAELCTRYEMHDKGDNVWLCTHKLKELGVDLAQWDRERGD